MKGSVLGSTQENKRTTKEKGTMQEKKNEAKQKQYYNTMILTSTLNHFVFKKVRKM